MKRDRPLSAASSPDFWVPLKFWEAGFPLNLRKEITWRVASKDSKRSKYISLRLTAACILLTLATFGLVLLSFYRYPDVPVGSLAQEESVLLSASQDAQACERAR